MTGLKKGLTVGQDKTNITDLAAYVKELFASGPGGLTGKGIELSIGAVLSKTALRGLPAPFNFLVPFVAEKIIIKYGVEEGREVLLKGLRWVKKVTDDKLDHPAVNHKLP